MARSLGILKDDFDPTKQAPIRYNKDGSAFVGNKLYAAGEDPTTGGYRGKTGITANPALFDASGLPRQGLGFGEGGGAGVLGPLAKNRLVLMDQAIQGRLGLANVAKDSAIGVATQNKEGHVGAATATASGVRDAATEQAGAARSVGLANAGATLDVGLANADATKAVAETKAGADKYVADQHLKGTDLTSSRGLTASQTQSGAQVEAATKQGESAAKVLAEQRAREAESTAAIMARTAGMGNIMAGVSARMMKGEKPTDIINKSPELAVLFVQDKNGWRLKSEDEFFGKSARR